MVLGSHVTRGMGVWEPVLSTVPALRRVCLERAHAAPWILHKYQPAFRPQPARPSADCLLVRRC